MRHFPLRYVSFLTASKLLSILALLLIAISSAWAQNVNVTFKANGKSVTKENVTLPHTYRCSYISEADELDLIIKELYGISQGYCWDSPAPSCSGDNITAGVDDNDIYFTLNKGFWGSATVTGTYFNTEPTIDATFPFNLEITSTPVTSISSVTLSPTAEVFQGEKLTLAPTVLPAEADYPTATWTSSNTSVATVDANGKVTAKSGGTTTITASYHNGTTATSDDKTVTCTVTVKAHVTGVTLAQTNALLLVGKTLTLTPTILPANATNKAVTWTSSNTTVATVSNKGVVTAKAAGTTTITVTTSDGSFKATCTVEVIEISEGTYIRLGSYNGEYVDWFAARSNSNGWVMLSKYVLKNMKFGSNSTYTGSNIYKWLDADANGTFEDELGLTTTERSLVKQVNLSSTNGDGTDRFIIPYRTGEQPNGSPYTKAPYIYDKSTICGAYWLREKRDETSPRVIRSSDATVEARYSGPTNSNGVRPMFYLDTDNLSGMTFTGSGTEDDPYVFVKRYSMDLDITPAAGATVTMTAKRNDETTFSGTMPQKFLESEFLDKIAGSTITLTVTPTNGYTFNNLTVTSGGAAVTVTGEGNTRTFTMPSADVTVKVDLNMATDGTGAYLIRSLNDWKLFCEQVAGGNTFSGETVKMTANVSGATTRTSNALANPFSGTFDGQGHTLNLNINVTTADATSAPFGYINGATIQNLVITGSETTAGMRPASIAGFAKNSTITNCKSTVALTSSRNADIDCGAIVARTESSSTVTLNGCLFTGSITYSNATGYEGGGMVGWTRAGTTATLTNCVFAPSAISITKYSGHYMFVGGKVRGTLTNCYYNDVAAASSLTKEGKQMCTISAGTDVTSLAISGEGTEYDVSGITAYAAGIKYGGVYYAGSGDELSLSLTHASAPAGYTFSQYTRDIKVGFAKGNLTRASSKWAFLANSWTYNTSPSVVDTEDGSQHFQWGTVFKEAESGESAVADGITTDLGAGWRGLSLAEWRYLLGYDGDNSGVQSPRRTVEWHYYAKIKGAGVGTGDERYLLIFPDDFKETDWTAAMGTAPTAFDGTDESSVAYTEANFTAMQNAGIAILPAAGYKQNDSWLNVGKYGGYRTNQATSSANAYRLMFTNNALNLRGTISKTTLKLSVRLANESANSGKLAGRFTVSSDGGTFSAQDETSATLVMPDANAVISATYTENKATLAESTDNSEWISDHNRDVYDITLTRTLQTGGWNTFTVPFNLDTPSGWTVKELTETEYDGTTLTLTFGDAENGIEAGKPYLVKVGDANVVNPTFDDVTIVNGTTETVTGYANFVPVMNPTWLTGSDKSVLFVTGGNTLTYPAADGNINGFRAYFQLTPGLAARSFVMNFGDEQTGIESLTPDPSPRGEGSIYSLDGRKVNGNVNVKKGVYVVNGKKVIIK